jgi:hypothetical protein
MNRHPPQLTLVTRDGAGIFSNSVWCHSFCPVWGRGDNGSCASN